MRFMRVCAALTAIGFFWAVPTSSHHNFSVAFDVERPVSVEGVITGIKWENPHTWIYVEVKRDDEQLEEWQFESQPPNPLRRKGVTPRILKPGVTVTLKGYGTYDRSKKIAAANIIVFANGESFSIGSGRQPPLKDDQ